MVFPSIVPVGNENVVENHGAEAQHDDLSDIANIERSVEAIGLESLPSDPVFVCKCRHVFPENIAEKPQLEPFVQSVYGDHDLVIVLKQEYLAALRQSVKLQYRKKQRNHRCCAQNNEADLGWLRGS
jgi:hypothetical protein